MRCEVEPVSDRQAEELVDALVCCTFCHEPFRECDTVIPGIGVVVGETDVVRLRGCYWHSGCVSDYAKTLGVSRRPLFVVY